MATSSIEWTGKVWNPIGGCSEKSPGCRNCYAAKMAYRLAHIPAMKKDYEGLTKKLPNGKITWTGLIREFPERLSDPFSSKKPTVFFVNSMSDLFHKDVSFQYIDKVFAIMALTARHTYQVLTKWPEKMAEYFSVGKDALIDRWEDAIYDMGLSDEDGDTDAPVCHLNNAINNLLGSSPDDKRYNVGWPLRNVWLGTSVENQKEANARIPFLLQVPAAVWWLSCEPLLSDLDLKCVPMDYEGTLINFDALEGKWHVTESGFDAGYISPRIKWVVAGGESGHKSTPVNPAWIKNIQAQCSLSDVPFFFKQWGEYVTPEQYSFEIGTRDIVTCKRIEMYGLEFYKTGKKSAGHLLDGKVYQAYPSV